MSMSLLPPCRYSIEMNIPRVNYQVFVCIHSHEHKEDLLDLEKSGVKMNVEEIEYNSVKGNLIAPEQLIDISCEQNVERDADQKR